MIIAADPLDAAEAYKLLIATVVPRAIGWVSTLSVAGVANLAPFSFFTVVGRKPPMVSISMQHRSDGVTLKDSFVNIRDTGEFVTNLVTLPLAEAMHRSAFEHASEVDEFEVTGLDKAASSFVRPARVASSPVSFECKLERIFTVGDHDDHVVWGRIVAFHIRDDLHLSGGRIDTAALPAVGRLAAEYTLVNNVFVTPVDPAFIATHERRRMSRLDDHADGFSPIDGKEWSPSGSVSSR